MLPLPACANADIPASKITKQAKKHARALPAKRPREFIPSLLAVIFKTRTATVAD
jgi:hypothetical protein